jgi:hypothetical protein
MSTVANLVATGTGIKWYDAMTGGNLLASTTLLASGNYYASQTVNNCESTRTLVAVSVTPITPAPVLISETFIVCSSSNPVIGNLVAPGTAIKWYDSLTGGMPLAITTPLVSQDYYVTQTLNGCESARTKLTVTVRPITPVPTVSAQVFCLSTMPTVSSLTATGTDILWYANATGGTPLTGSVAIATGTYYVTQTLNGCESARQSVSVTVHPITPAPTAMAQTFCASTMPTVANLVATATGTIQWYNVATGGTALTSTTALASGTYYVTNTVNNCESTRTSVSITVTPITPLPTAMAQTFCASTMPTVTNLVATGTAIQWYNAAT